VWTSGELCGGDAQRQWQVAVHPGDLLGSRRLGRDPSSARVVSQELDGLRRIEDVEIHQPRTG